MKPQTKIHILVTVETTVIITGSMTLTLLLLPPSFPAFLSLIAAIAASLLLGFCIVKYVMKLTWKETWARFRGEEVKNDG